MEDLKLIMKVVQRFTNISGKDLTLDQAVFIKVEIINAVEKIVKQMNAK